MLWGTAQLFVSLALVFSRKCANTSVSILGFTPLDKLGDQCPATLFIHAKAKVARQLRRATLE